MNLNFLSQTSRLSFIMEDNAHGRISTTWHSGTNTAPYLAHGEKLSSTHEVRSPSRRGLSSLCPHRHKPVLYTPWNPGILTVEIPIPTLQQYPVGTALGNTGAAKQSPAPHSPVGDALSISTAILTSPPSTNCQCQSMPAGINR